MSRRKQSNPRQLKRACGAVQDADREVKERESMVGGGANPENALESDLQNHHQNHHQNHIHSKRQCMGSGTLPWSSTTQPTMKGEELAACTMDFLLQMQTAATATIQPTSLGNEDMYPCGTCRIWFHSDRNLQAHQMYYCNGRQRESDTPTDNPPMDTPMAQSLTPAPPHFPQSNRRLQATPPLDTPLSIHAGLKAEKAFSAVDWVNAAGLSCTICCAAADSVPALQHHVLSHLGPAGRRCGRCSFRFHTASELQRHQDRHGHTDPRAPAGPLPRSTTTEKTQHSEPETLLPGSPTVLASGEISPVAKHPDGGQVAGRGAGGPGLRACVKSEPSSPRLAASPIQHHVAPPFPLNPFVPHLPLAQDVSALPQASEILVKMSELVHRRLRRGGGTYPPLLYGPLLPKGATCFECSITFSSLENYLVHKKHYCSSRWASLAPPHEPQLMDGGSESSSPKSSSSKTNQLLFTGLPAGKGKLYPPNSDSIPTNKETSSENMPSPPGTEERSKGRQVNSPGNESGSDGSQTTCEACKITFSRQETYDVHKQYYCASRHDPPAKRLQNSKVPASQRAVRTRKRRRACEVPDQGQEVVPPHGMSYLGVAAGSHLYPGALETLREKFLSRFPVVSHGLLPRHPEASLTLSRSALGSSSGSSGLEAPMDLSRKCLPALENVAPSQSELLDYHECVVCKISFNKVEDYLTHKQTSCPGTALSSITLQDVKEEDNDARDDKSPTSDTNTDTISQTGVPAAGAPTAQAGMNPHSPQPAATLEVRSEEGSASKEHAAAPKRPRAPDPEWQGCGTAAELEPQCSPTQGGEGPLGTATYQLSPDHPERRLLADRSKIMPVNGLHSPAELMENTGDHPHLPSSPPTPPAQDGPPIPRQTPPPPDARLCASARSRLSGSVPAGNVKYCRPCDIQFHNLSNFITHKKFYCSSHTAEHVK